MPATTDLPAVMRQLVEAFNDRDRERFDACYAPQVVVHASSGESRTMTQDEHWEEVLGMFEVFPDLRARIDQMLSDGDRLFLRGAYTGTHEGSSRQATIEPTGRTATWAWWCEYRFEDGRIAEAWNIYDGVSQLKQLGLWQPPGPSPAADDT